jgi:hypothetical protein
MPLDRHDPPPGSDACRVRRARYELGSFQSKELATALVARK